MSIIRRGYFSNRNAFTRVYCFMQIHAGLFSQLLLGIWHSLTIFLQFYGCLECFRSSFFAVSGPRLLWNALMYVLWINSEQTCMRTKNWLYILMVWNRAFPERILPGNPQRKASFKAIDNKIRFQVNGWHEKRTVYTVWYII